jgi:hypothetical protein
MKLAILTQLNNGYYPGQFFASSIRQKTSQ